MTTKTTKTTIAIGSIDNAIELVFIQANNDHRYILQPNGTTEDYLSTLQRFPNHSIKCTTHCYIDDPDGLWYACYNVDCFDPPMAVIRARTFEDAYDVFCDEFSDWLKVEESDAADYPEAERNYSASGVHIDTSNVQIAPMHLVSLTTLESRGNE